MTSNKDWLQVQVEVTPTPSAGGTEAIPVISAKGKKPNKNAFVNYSLARQITISNGDLIEFDDMQRAIMNTLDECYDRKEELLSIDMFIRRLFHEDSAEPSEELKTAMVEQLKTLAMLTGATISGGDDDSIDISLGALIPIRLHVKMNVNGKIISDGIAIMGHTCIYGMDTRKVEYWRLQSPNKRMRKTEKNIIIGRTVLESYLKGDPVEISNIEERLETVIDDPQARQRLIRVIMQFMDHQYRLNGQTDRIQFNEEKDGTGAGRPRIKSLYVNGT